MAYKIPISVSQLELSQPDLQQIFVLFQCSGQTENCFRQELQFPYFVIFPFL